MNSVESPKSVNSDLQIDTLWNRICSEVRAQIKQEPFLANFLNTAILQHSSFEHCLSFCLAKTLGETAIPVSQLQDIFYNEIKSSRILRDSTRADLVACVVRDPACTRYSLPLLYFKGYQGLQAYRLSNAFWKSKRTELAYYLQSRINKIFSMDIHPAATIGEGILLDHGTGVVIGETAIIGSDVSILHEVTLGGTGKDTGDRHPKVHSGVLIGAGAKVLGNITLGKNSKIAAGSVVLHNVKPYQTVAGVPAVPVGKIVKNDCPANNMDHSIRSYLSGNQ